ncbi:MAG TPA: DUF6599 family protein [Terriglobia bacterium]|nr:DUF6599 family protein [Terriglobia bacterium]
MIDLSARRLWPFFVLAAALPLAASQKSVVMPLLPVATWKVQSEGKLSIESFGQFGDQTAVDKELGVTAGSERDYAKGNLQATAIFEEAADPSSAYALYTLYQTVGFNPVPGVQLAAAGPKYALMTRGRYFIRVLRSPGSQLTDQDLRSLLIMIGGAHLSAENLRSLPRQLPQRGLTPGSEKYLLGLQSAKLALPSFPVNLIGFEDGVEAHVGTYLNGGNRMKLLEIDYPTPQIAELQFQQMAKALHINQEGSSGTPRTPIYGQRHGSYSLLVLGADSKAAADQLLMRFKVTQIVSEVPEYPRKDNFAYQMVELVLANGELVIIICLLAILGGIVIYLTKQLIMKLFPNSGLIRADDDILIRLKLT